MSEIMNKRPERYSRASIILHWLMLLVLVAVYAAIEFREYWPKGSAPRDLLKNWHFMLGLSIFGLVWLRIAARLVWPAPRPLPGPAWQRRLAATTHLALYLFLIAMPVAGWLVLSGEGRTILFFGFTLPPLIAPDGALAERMEEWHELGGTIGYGLVGLHAAAALFHHYILKDKVLLRMFSV